MVKFVITIPLPMNETELLSNLRASCQQVSHPPFFIVGSGRSGTTLVQTLLDSHPHIAIPPESHIFYRFAEILHCYRDLGQPQNLTSLVRDILNDKKIKPWGLNITPDEFCSLLEENSFRGILSLLFGLYASKHGKIRWGEKTPRHVLYLNEIKQVFPEAKIIHLVRDGRDVACSYYRVYFGPKRIDKIAETWCQYLNAADGFKRKSRPEDFLEIKYEEIVEDPNRMIKTICDFLGDSSFEVNGKVPDTPTKSFYLNKKEWHYSLNEAITKNKVGLFKSNLSRREIAIFESIAKDELSRHGYALLTSADAKISWREQIGF